MVHITPKSETSSTCHLIGYVTHFFIQEDISGSKQNQVNTFQDEIGPNQRQASSI